LPRVERSAFTNSRQRSHAMAASWPRRFVVECSLTVLLLDEMIFALSHKFPCSDVLLAVL
jgi:hypothetical protein